jgi:hypothetical protein
MEGGGVVEPWGRSVDAVLSELGSMAPRAVSVTDAVC